MKPVTELYGRLEHWAATDIDDAEVFHSFQAGAAIQQLAKSAGMDTPRFLEVLDLVATSNRLGLVRWVAGLSHEDALRVFDALVEAQRPLTVEDKQDWELLERLHSGLSAALSGGDSGAKEEPPGAREPSSHRWAGGGDYGGGEKMCADCGVNLQDDEAERPCGAKEETTLAPITVGSVTYVPDGRLAHGEAFGRASPRVLPAGWPPPFLRVGMVMQMPHGKAERIVELPNRWDVEFTNGWSAKAYVVLTWPLAEDFAVEGES